MKFPAPSPTPVLPRPAVEESGASQGSNVFWGAFTLASAHHPSAVFQLPASFKLSACIPKPVLKLPVVLYLSARTPAAASKFPDTLLLIAVLPIAVLLPP